MKGVVNALRCLRGLDLVAATIFIAEIGDLSRFAHPKALMKAFGITFRNTPSATLAVRVPSPRQATNKPGRILVEAALDLLLQPTRVALIEIRQQGQPKAIRDIAWPAQLRLAYRFRKLNAGRKMTQNKCCVAVARELAGFIWDIARQVQIPT